MKLPACTSIAKKKVHLEKGVATFPIGPVLALLAAQVLTNKQLPYHFSHLLGQFYSQRLVSLSPCPATFPPFHHLMFALTRTVTHLSMHFSQLQILHGPAEPVEPGPLAVSLGPKLNHTRCIHFRDKIYFLLLTEYFLSISFYDFFQCHLFPPERRRSNHTFPPFVSLFSLLSPFSFRCPFQPFYFVHFICSFYCFSFFASAWAASVIASLICSGIGPCCLSSVK